MLLTLFAWCLKPCHTDQRTLLTNKRNHLWSLIKACLLLYFEMGPLTECGKNKVSLETLRVIPILIIKCNCLLLKLGTKLKSVRPLLAVYHFPQNNQHKIISPIVMLSAWIILDPSHYLTISPSFIFYTWNEEVKYRRSVKIRRLIEASKFAWRENSTYLQ